MYYEENEEYTVILENTPETPVSEAETPVSDEIPAETVSEAVTPVSEAETPVSDEIPAETVSEAVTPVSEAETSVSDEIPAETVSEAVTPVSEAETPVSGEIVGEEISSSGEVIQVTEISVLEETRDILAEIKETAGFAGFCVFSFLAISAGRSFIRSNR